MDNRTLGLLIVGAGAALAVVGLVVWAGGLSWVGRLPGDLRFERGGTRVYVPLASMLLVSLVLSVVLSLIRRFL